MNFQGSNNLVKETIYFPVIYDKEQQAIWDSRGMMVCDMKGWGKMALTDSEELQDTIGEKIAKLLNESGADRLDFHDETKQEAGVFSSREKVLQFEWD